MHIRRLGWLPSDADENRLPHCIDAGGRLQPGNTVKTEF